MRKTMSSCTNQLATYVVKKEFVPIFSYHHLQKPGHHMKMCERIRYGVSRNPSTLHSFRWNSCFQGTSSVVDLIHHAEKFKCQLIIDVNPLDVYAQFLWKGIRHMYPDTLLFDTYQLNHYRMRDNLENVKIRIPSDTSVTTLRSLQLPQNTILTTHSSESTHPTYATWISGDTSRTLLYVPMHNV